MFMDWLTAAGFVSALAAAVGWYYCQAWESKQAAAQDRLPPRFRALAAGGFSRNLEYAYRADLARKTRFHP